jgi:integral membrane sensor domain MASE1
MKTRPRKIHSKRSWIGTIWLTLGVGIVCFFAAQLSLELLVNPDGFVAFWLAAGLSSGVLIAFGPGTRWPVIAGVVAATISANIVADRNVWVRLRMLSAMRAKPCLLRG